MLIARLFKANLLYLTARKWVYKKRVCVTPPSFYGLTEVSMLESRRGALSAFASFVGFVASGRFASSLLAQPPDRQVPKNCRVPPSPPPKLNGGSTEFDGAPDQSGSSQPPDVQYLSSLRTDVEKLWTMANELKEDVVHINPRETLSVAFIRKAQAIEKLAKQIRDHARG